MYKKNRKEPIRMRSVLSESTLETSILSTVNSIMVATMLQRSFYHNYRGNTGECLIFAIYLVLSLGVSGTYQQQRPRITSRPNHPLISTIQGRATFNWTFILWRGTTWNDTVVEVVFGTWRPSGILSPKLMVITKEGGVLIRPHFENKVSCEFNVSRLQVAFMLNNLSVQDEKQYGVQIEFGLAYNPLTDAVSLRLQDPPKIINPSKRNINIKTGADLNLTCAAKGLPSPQITWTRLGRQTKNQTVVLKELTKEDSGLYLCTARNTAGKDTMEVNVIVEGEESLQTVEPSTTNTEHTTDNKWITLMIVLAAFVFLMASVLFTYFVCKRLRNTSIRYNPQVDTGTPNSQSTSVSI